MKKFNQQNNALKNQFNPIKWDEQSGISEAELNDEFEYLMNNKKGLSKAMLKAKTYELIASKSRIAIDEDDIFQDKLFGGNIIFRQREMWENEVKNEFLKSGLSDPENDSVSEENICWEKYGSHIANGDYGHTSPNSKLLLEIGFTGLLKRAESALEKEGLSEKQKDFYNSCIVTLNAAIHFMKRLSEASKECNPESSRVLENLTERAPADIREAMQLIIIYFFFHEYVGGTRVRTLGRLDVLLYPFYKKDIENGVYSKEEIKEMLKFFLNKFWLAKVPYDLPFCLGGMLEDGTDATNDMSYLIVETYNELNIHSPKIHIRVCDKTPEEFVKLVLKCIRGGNSSFVFVNDRVGIECLKKVGIEENDARNYVPIGCYEPAVWGVEIGCTGNGGVNLAKAVEYVVTNGVDFKSGDLCAVRTGKINTFEEFVDAVKIQIAYLTDKCLNYISTLERHYDEITPDPMLSSMYDMSIERGVDVYEGGAKYNNSSLYYYCIASLVDSVLAVKKLVYDDGDVTFDELCEILARDWKGFEKLRLKALYLCEKYGNNTEFANELIKEFTDYIASISLNKPNGRGGVFKPAIFSIDHYVFLGKRTMATPDGRFAGDILSKNLCPNVGMDKNGITAVINSVTQIDFTKFPTGSVLDIILHPSAVAGVDGIDAFYGVLMTYFRKGGYAMHGNVFDSSSLRAAQKNPGKYKNLQVRVCGWNAYFVNLSKEEQDAFIKQAENI